MARTYAYALFGALAATFTVTPVLASLMLPKHVEEVETWVVRKLRETYTPATALGAGQHQVGDWRRADIPGYQRSRRVAARHGISSGAGGGQFLDQSANAADHLARFRHRGDAQDARDFAPASGSDHRRFAARASRQRLRRLALFECRAVRAAQAFRPMAGRTQQGKADRRNTKRVRRRNAGHRLQLLAIYSGQRRGGAFRRQGREFDQDRRTQSHQARGTRRSGAGRGSAGQGHRRPRHIPCHGPAQSQHQGGPGQGRALRTEQRRRQHGHSGRDGRRRGDDRARRRSSIWIAGPAASRISQLHRRGSQRQGRIRHFRAASTPISP